MDLRLQNFKEVIANQILERGRSYFGSGRVQDLEMEEEGHWSAQVLGSEDYDVEIEQTETGTLDCSCTCPYDYGPYCKHIAAVLFAIEAGAPQETRKRGRQKPKARQQSQEEQLSAALNMAPQEELVSVLLDLAGSDNQIADQLLLRFNVVKEDKAAYGKIVRHALRAHMDEGFLDYRASMDAGSRVFELLTRADQLLEHKAWQSAVDFYRAVLENVVEVLMEADDSSGSLGDCAAHAVEGLRNAAQVASPSQKQTLFTDCLEDAQSPRQADWDWRWDLYAIAADLVTTPDQRQELFAALDTYQVRPAAPTGFTRHDSMYLRDDFSARYNAERAASIQLSVIQREEGEQAAEAFIAAHVSMDRFRKMLIERYLQRNDLKAVKQLAAEGAAISEQQRYAGLVADYQQVLLEIAKREKDSPEIARLARELLLGRGAPGLYDLLKTNVPETTWPAFLKGLLADAQAQHDTDLIYSIYAREGMWQNLLDEAKHRWTESIDPYRQELERRFPDEVAQIYERTARRMLERTSNRDTYQAACNFLKRMKKLGKEAQVQAVVADLRQQYRNRRALLGELDKV